jgi:hypothetical protein
LKATDGASILPQGFGAVDIHSLCWVKVHDFGGLALGGYPHVKRWLDGLLERKGCLGSLLDSTMESRCSLIDPVLSNRFEEVEVPNMSRMERTILDGWHSRTDTQPSTLSFLFSFAHMACSTP